MIDYAVLLWPDSDDACQALDAARRIAVHLEGAGWLREVNEPGRIVLLRGCHRSPVVRLIGDDTILIGHVFDRSATEAGRVEPLRTPAGAAPFDVMCTWWADHGWGAYVAIHRSRDAPATVELFRDPIGMLDCVCWKHGLLHVTTSVPEPLLDVAPPPDLAISWSRVAGLLRLPGSAGENLPLVGLDVPAPGTSLRLSIGTPVVRTFWSPACFARRPTTSQIAATLPDLVDACVAAWCSTTSRAIGELSGGLDSAIVASGVTRLAPPPATTWFNYRSIDREGDERRYARAVADRLALDLVEHVRDDATIDEDLMAAIPPALRPPIASLGLFHDADLAERGRALGADTLLTGQGGDALFFQPASPLVAADFAFGFRSWRQSVAALPDIAMWTNRSGWSVLGTMAQSRLRSAPLPMPALRHDLVDPAFPVALHPIGWMSDAADLPPAKQLEILNLATARAAFGPSYCSSAMRVVHPLMSQPLLEHVLSIPAITLTRGRRDRALIREAYRNRLPGLLVERHGKGCLTAFYGRMLARSVPFLRTYLLDGVLATDGILQTGRLDALLDPDALMRTNAYTEIIVIMIMERWAREWSKRITNLNRKSAKRV
jgi:asparagine synthase (glutamine-hydrolysing)